MDEQEKITSTACFDGFSLKNSKSGQPSQNKYLAAIKAPLSGNSVITS